MSSDDTRRGSNVALCRAVEQVHVARHWQGYDTPVISLGEMTQF
ncbi:MAG TPA: hypothetical protein VGK49_07285 [Ilumatobacteraceae bacterium]